MTAEVVQFATPDPDRLRAFQPCIDNYGLGDSSDAWANNCLANDTVAYSNGLIARAGVPPDLRFDPDELALCTQLAVQASRVMGPRWPGMYSANDAPTAPFYMASTMFIPRPAPDPDSIRIAF